jgi:glycosyltransferase involved in cell wall biosynthesis
MKIHAPRKPAICMFIWNFFPAVGGAEQQCFRLSQELASQGFTIFVVTKRFPGYAKTERIGEMTVHRVPSLSGARKALQGAFRGLFPKLAESGKKGRQSLALPARVLIKAHNVLTERLPRYAFMVSAYWKLYRERHAMDILHVHEGHWIASLGARFAARNGKKVLIKEASSGDYLRLNFSTQIWPESTRRADVFIAISRQIARDLRGVGVPEENIRIIPNGVMLPSGSWSPPQGPDRNVVFVGNLSQQPYKGIDILLKAWKSVKAADAGATLILLGGGDATDLKALCAELGIADRVMFKGAVKNVEDYLLAASLFVLPSRIEGMSNSLLEAMALGLPVVSTDISGSEDLIQTGENGLLVPKEDPVALSEAILRMLKDRSMAEDMGRKARLSIGAGFTIQAVAQRYAELYDSMLAGNPIPKESQ